MKWKSAISHPLRTTRPLDSNAILYHGSILTVGMASDGPLPSSLSPANDSTKAVDLSAFRKPVEGTPAEGLVAQLSKNPFFTAVRSLHPTRKAV